jgi:hypothetical protein
MMPVTDRMTDFYGRSNFLSSGQFMGMKFAHSESPALKAEPLTFG